MLTENLQNMRKSYDFYTMLVLTYVIDGAEIQKKTLYRTAYECGNALPEVYEHI